MTVSSLTLLILGRIIAGFTSGSQPIAQAAIIDLSTSENKTRNLGYILLALSLGFIVGPLFGGILADHRIISWFDFSTPFYFAAIISFINIILLWLLFNETFVSRSTTFSINLYSAIRIFISGFKHIKVRNLSFLFFIFIFGWSSFYSFIGLFLLKVFNFTPTEVSLFMAMMGIGFGIGTGYLVNFVARLFSLRDSFICCIFISGIMILLMRYIPSSLFNWIMIAPLACFVSTGYACILTHFSNQVDESSQGWVMGITGSIMALVWAINGITVGIIAAFNPATPLLIAGLCLLLTSIAAYYLSPK